MPIPTRNMQNKGPRGLASVKVLAKKVTVSFDEGQRNGSGMYEFDRSVDGAIPDAIGSGDGMWVEISPDGNRIRNVRPPDGNYFVVLDRFVSKKDGPPIPKLVPSKSGVNRQGGAYTIPEHLEFYTILRVVNHDKYDGMEFFHSLWYQFPQYEDTDFCVVPSKGKLHDFLLITGMDFDADTIPYSDNVLPAVEKILLGKGAVFMAQIENGFVKTLTPAPAGTKVTKKKAKK